MRILLSFLPWVLFYGFYSLQKLVLGMCLSILIYFLLFLKDAKELKLLDYCSVIFFIAVTICIEFFHSSWVNYYIDYLGNAFLAVVVLFSIIIKRPFTLSYAKATTNEKYWQSAEFLKINIIISSFWFIYFCLSMLVMWWQETYCLTYGLVQLSMFIFLLLLTKKFPDWYRNYVK